MELTPQQLDVVDDVVDWFQHRPEQVYNLHGFAGTGKTTLAKHVRDRLSPAVVQFATFTGKAAHVLQTKDCWNARTIHSLIYTPKQKCMDRLRRLRQHIEELAEDEEATDEERELAQRKYDDEQENVSRPDFSLNLSSDLLKTNLLVIDECSMVGEEIARDLLSFGVKILAMGDPAQLPPVKDTPYFMDAEPDALLTQIHRQAEESPILQLATLIREGNPDWSDHPLIRSKGELDVGQVAAFDQVLVGTNKTRIRVIDRIRNHFGFRGEVPNLGERLVCTRNDPETGLLNGSQWIVKRADYGGWRIALELASCEGMGTVECVAHVHPFRGEKIPWFEIREAQCLEFAYALTVHKAQGSEWPDVCYIDEAGRFPSDVRRALRYTAVTRASQNLAVIR